MSDLPPPPEGESPLLSAFIETLQQLLEGLHECFPECFMTAQVVANFNAIVLPSAEARAATIQQWHVALRDYYTCFDKHDIETLRSANIPLMGMLQVIDKYYDPDLDEESRDVLWEYLENLNNYAKLHNEVPASIMSRVAAMTSSLHQNMQGGETSLADVNIQEMAMSIVGDSTADELEEFTASLPNLLNSFGGMGRIMEMASQMQSHVIEQEGADSALAQEVAHANTMLAGVDADAIARVLGGTSSSNK